MTTTKLLEHWFINVVALLVSSIAYGYLIAHLCGVWLSPELNDVGFILSFSGLVSFEFFTVIAGLFIFTAPSRFSLLIIASVFGVLVIGANSMLPDNSLLSLYAITLLRRFMFFSSEDREAKLTSAMLPIIFYALIVIMLIVPLSSFIPEFGLNDGFLLESAYVDLKKDAGLSGLFFDHPKLSFAFAVLYFFLLALSDVLRTIFSLIEHKLDVKELKIK